ncbi:MAG: triphosphoribosyl-dephospho-CoA synthase [Gammaproteobacteria bacterium]|nr:triphosphoribosyl-dephospho-CoA synthase [Gammaproteobacteria bacterium]
MRQQSPWTQEALERAVLESLLGEINALKPGNVHRFSGGHGMRYEDFLVSAQAVVPILCSTDLTLGERCLEAVLATRKAVCANTNLGIVLLFAPIICAAQQGDSPSGFRTRIRKVISAADHDDTVLIYRAIAVAEPGGLGRVPVHDVHAEPDCSLLEAMSAAEDRDRVASQYTNACADLFAVGLPALKGYVRRGIGVEWAAVGCYLRFLACFPDSHIRRKHGAEVARQVSQRAEATLAELEQHNDPSTMTGQLLGLDREWKDSGINPGTSADLTAASLLLYHLGVEDFG